MNLWDIALKNLMRRKVKMLFLILSLAFGVATIVTLVTVSDAMQGDINSHFAGMGSRVILKPNTEKLSFSYGPIVIASGVSYGAKDLESGTLEKLKELGTDQLGVISPKLLVNGKIKDKAIMMVGIDFDEELKLRNYWSVEGKVPQTEAEILIGNKVAKTLQITTGDTVQVNEHQFVVSGILHETSSEEDGLIFAQLPTVQETFGKQNLLTFVELQLQGTNTSEEVDAAVKTIATKLPDAEVVAVKDAIDSRKQLVERFTSFSLIISVVVTIIGALIVMAAMMSSVNDRTREIGIFRAIGYRKSHVTRIILIEAGTLSIFGAVLGYTIGIISAIKLAPVLTGLKLTIAWNPVILVGVFLGTMLIGLVSATYPAAKAAKLNPAEALRFI